MFGLQPFDEGSLENRNRLLFKGSLSRALFGVTVRIQLLP